MKTIETKNGSFVGKKISAKLAKEIYMKQPYATRFISEKGSEHYISEDGSTLYYLRSGWIMSKNKIWNI